MYGTKTNLDIRRCRVQLVQQRWYGVWREMSRCSDTLLQSTLQILRSNPIWIIRRRPECDRKVVVYRVKEELLRLVSNPKLGSELPYLCVVRYIPFHHDYFEVGKYNHEVSWVLFASHQIYNSHERLVTHLTQCYHGLAAFKCMARPPQNSISHIPFRWFDINSFSNWYTWNLCDCERDCRSWKFPKRLLSH